MNEDESARLVTLTLTRQESIVLFEFLSRYTETKKLTIEDQAEERVLWDICSMLESELHEPISRDFGEILARARAAVRDPAE